MPFLAALKLTCRSLRFALLIPAVLSAAHAAETFKVGDKVEVWNVAWYPAEVVTIGTGEHAGQYYIHYTGRGGGGSEQWILAKNLRPAVAAASTAAVEPRLGKYRVYSYGANSNRLFLGEIELLPGGHYRAAQAGGKVTGEGDYRYDHNKHAVVWRTGPYHGDDWAGGFEVSREGKTHTVRLRRNMIATNSTDAP